MPDTFIGDLPAFVAAPNAGPLNPVMRVIGVGHHNPSAEDAWGRILRWFDAYLGGMPGSANSSR